MNAPIIVVGGGASGMMAAGRAAEYGVPVILLEKMDRLGTKLRITGKGRCNLTNTAPLREFVNHFGDTGPFLYRSFSRFFHPDLRAFLEQRGVPTVEERGRRVFPYSNKAYDVIRAFQGYLEDNDVQVIYGTRVTDLLTENGAITGVETNQGSYQCSIIILATGGASYPATGSTGDGYRLAKDQGHHIVPIKPALVPLVTKEDWVPTLQGLTLHNIQATLYINDESIAQEFGELLFTHFGISGPVVLTLSKAAVQALGTGRIQLGIDLKPALDDEQLEDRLQRDFDEQGAKHFRNILQGLVPLRMRDLFIELTGIPRDKRGSQINAEERGQLAGQLRDLRVTIIDSRSMDEAIVTAGGVDIHEIDAHTMASKLVDGLFFCGEVIDVDADTGGYNLQAAFSTGRLAGESAAAVWTDQGSEI